MKLCNNLRFKDMLPAIQTALDTATEEMAEHYQELEMGLESVPEKLLNYTRSCPATPPLRN